MTRAAVLLLLVAAGTARADVPPPVMAYIPVELVVMIDHDSPDHDYYVVNWYDLPARYVLSKRHGRGPEEAYAIGTRAKPVSAAGPYRYHAEPPRNRYGIQGVQRVNVYAVRRSQPGFEATSIWLDQPGNATLIAALNPSADAGGPDAVRPVELTYRIEPGPDGGRVVRVTEAPAEPAVGGGRWTGWVVGGVAAVGVVWLGLWYARRVRRE